MARTQPTALPTYTATKARVNFGALLKRVQTKDPRIIIEKGGVPAAMLVDMNWYEDMLDSVELKELVDAHNGEQGVSLESVLKKYDV